MGLAAKLTDAPDKQLQIFVWLAILALLPVVAAISYHLVEHPARKALRGMGKRGDKTSASSLKSGATPKQLATEREPVA